MSTICWHNAEHLWPGPVGQGQTSRHRPSQVLPCGFPRSGVRGRSPLGQEAEQPAWWQLCREPPTGTKDARLQACEISLEVFSQPGAISISAKCCSYTSRPRSGEGGAHCEAMGG